MEHQWLIPKAISDAQSATLASHFLQEQRNSKTILELVKHFGNRGKLVQQES